MCALMVQQGLHQSLEGESRLGVAMAEKAKKALFEKASNATILSLSEKMLRQVSKEKTATKLWTKLECFYLTVTS